MKAWNILYRGSLSSCNYECGYCPFAKTTNSRAELSQDERELERFIVWVASHSRPIGILITPWGEALVHRYYREGMVKLSRFPNVYRVSVQTNLGAPIDDFTAANRDTLALWTTFHPSQTTLGRFAARCQELDEARIRYSVGMVGLREHFDAIEELRRILRPEVYLWVNAFKQVGGYYQPGEIQRLCATDPYFHWNLSSYQSAGKPCSAGETTFTVDGDGVLREVNRRGAAMLGFDSELLRGRPFDGFLTADSGRTLREMLKRVSHGATADCAELELHGMQSEIRSVRAHACLDPAGGGFLIALSEGAGSGHDAIGE